MRLSYLERYLELLGVLRISGIRGIRTKKPRGLRACSNSLLGLSHQTVFFSLSALTESLDNLWSFVLVLSVQPSGR